MGGPLRSRSSQSFECQRPDCDIFRSAMPACQASEVAERFERGSRTRASKCFSTVSSSKSLVLATCRSTLDTPKSKMFHAKERRHPPTPTPPGSTPKNSSLRKHPKPCITCLVEPRAVGASNTTATHLCRQRDSAVLMRLCCTSSYQYFCVLLLFLLHQLSKGQNHDAI